MGTVAQIENTRLDTEIRKCEHVSLVSRLHNCDIDFSKRDDGVFTHHSSTNDMKISNN